MATYTQKRETEQRIRDLLDEARLPEPDEVEYGYTCVRLFWHHTKTCVVIDIDEDPDGDAAEADAPEATA